MIYRLMSDERRFQHIFFTLDFSEIRFRKISRRWNALETPGGWYQMTGLGAPIQDSEIRQRFLDLFAEYPNEISLGGYPQEPADIVPEFNPPVVALSTAMEAKAAELLEHIATEGVLVDYPYGLPFDHVLDWLASEETLNKWPQLKDLEKHPIEIEDYGSKYLLCDPSVLEGYRIKLFYCTNWQHELVDRELTKGGWDTRIEDGVTVRYYTAEPGAGIVVFRRMPPAGTWLFRIPEKSIGVFCTQDFKDAYDAHGLKGVIFQPMALSESYVPPPPPPPRRWEDERA